MNEGYEKYSPSNDMVENTSFSHNLSQSNTYLSTLINSQRQTKNKLLAVGFLILLSVVIFISYGAKLQADIRSNLNAINQISSVKSIIEKSDYIKSDAGKILLDTNTSQGETGHYDIKDINSLNIKDSKQLELLNKALELSNKNTTLVKNINEKHLRIHLENQLIQSLNDRLISFSDTNSISSKKIKTLNIYLSNINQYWANETIDALAKVEKSINLVNKQLVNEDVLKQLQLRLATQRTNLNDLNETLPSHQVEIHKNIDQALNLSKNIQKQLFESNTELASETKMSAFALTAFIILLLLFSFSEFKKSKNEMRHAYRSFNREATVMQHNYLESMQESQARTNFLSIVTYEARIALDAILGLTKIAKRSSKSDEQKNKLIQVISSGTKLNSLLNNISTFLELDDKLISLEEELVPMKEILEDISNEFTQESEKNHVLFESYIDPNIAKFYLADKDKLVQILKHLLNNSCNYTEKGHIVFKVEVDQAQLLSREEQRINFTIEDTGIPLNKEDQLNFFNAFTQANSTSSRGNHGESIKLSIAKRLIQLMGGDITIDNSQGSGIKINFYVLLAIADHTAIDNAVKQAESKNQRSNKIISFQRLDILIVEDNEANASLLAWILEDMKHKVHIAENGIECLNLLESNSFDLIFMDQHMPEMNGIIATEKIRKRSDYKANTAIIGCTADGNQETIDKLLQAGQNDVILKPISEDTIFTVTQNFIKGQYTHEVIPDDENDSNNTESKVDEA